MQAKHEIICLTMGGGKKKDFSIQKSMILKNIEISISQSPLNSLMSLLIQFFFITNIHQKFPSVFGQHVI
jgi:hypothetical protein